MAFRFSAALRLHTGEAAWRFITLPTDVADEIDDITGPTRIGFGSVRVTATIGATTWNTSIFPDKAAESYVLPVKKEVRARENLHDGDAVEVTLQLASST